MSESRRHAYFSSIRRFQKQKKKINKSWHRSVRQKSALAFFDAGFVVCVLSLLVSRGTTKSLNSKNDVRFVRAIVMRLKSKTSQSYLQSHREASMLQWYTHAFNHDKFDPFGHETMFGRLLLTRYNIFVSRSSFLHFVALKMSRRTWDVHNTSNYIIVIVVTSLCVCRAAVTTHIVLYCKKKNVRTIH